MVSMCEDCRTEKNKVKTFNKQLLSEHCIKISKFLQCKNCCKFHSILDDNEFKTLHPEQQQLYILVKLFPFPTAIKEFKRMVSKSLLPEYFVKDDLKTLKQLVNRRTFHIIKKYYNVMYIENAYKEYFVWNGFSRTIQEEINNSKLQWRSWYLVKTSIKLILRYYLGVNIIPFRHCNIHSIDDFKEFYFWKIDQQAIF